MQHWLQEAPGERRGNLESVVRRLLQADNIADRVRSHLGLPPIYD